MKPGAKSYKPAAALEAAAISVEEKPSPKFKSWQEKERGNDLQWLYFQIMSV